MVIVVRGGLLGLGWCLGNVLLGVWVRVGGKNSMILRGLGEVWGFVVGCVKLWGVVWGLRYEGVG